MMPLWQSAQVLLPTKLAPGIAGGAVTVAGAMEHELTSRAMTPAAPTKTAPMMTRPGFIPGYVRSIPHMGSASKRRLLWLSVAII